MLTSVRVHADSRTHSHSHARPVSSDPADRELVEADRLQQRHAFREAEQLLTSLLERNPRHAQALLMRAQIRLHLRDSKSALQDCHHVTLSADVLTGFACTAQARIAAPSSASELERTLQRLTQLLDATPATPAVASWASGVAGELALRVGRSAEAGRWLKQAQSLDPNNHFAQQSYAEWLKRPHPNPPP